MRFCIGRGAWADKKCDQWDGAVENVKLWTRALSQVSLSLRPLPELSLSFTG
jgi:hypothetical protein